MNKLTISGIAVVAALALGVMTTFPSPVESVVATNIPIETDQGVGGCIKGCQDTLRAQLEDCRTLPSAEREACIQAAVAAYRACVELCRIVG